MTSAKCSTNRLPSLYTVSFRSARVKYLSVSHRYYVNNITGPSAYVKHSATGMPRLIQSDMA